MYIANREYGSLRKFSAFCCPTYHILTARNHLPMNKTDEKI